MIRSKNKDLRGSVELPVVVEGKKVGTAILMVQNLNMVVDTEIPGYDKALKAFNSDKMMGFVLKVK